MKIILKPGETITVGFHESDGEIAVSFEEKSIDVVASLPDTSGRDGLIYQEIFGFHQDWAGETEITPRMG